MNIKEILEARNQLHKEVRGQSQSTRKDRKNDYNKKRYYIKMNTNTSLNLKNFMAYSKTGKTKSTKTMKRDYATAYFTRSIWNAYINNEQEAMKDINACIKINKEHPDAHFHKATLYYDKEQWSIAINNFKRALVHDPEYHEAYLLQAKCYYELKKYNLATKHIQLYIEAIPNKDPEAEHLLLWYSTLVPS